MEYEVHIADGFTPEDATIALWRAWQSHCLALGDYVPLGRCGPRLIVAHDNAKSDHRLVPSFIQTVVVADAGELFRIREYISVREVSGVVVSQGSGKTIGVGIGRSQEDILAEMLESVPLLASEMDEVLSWKTMGGEVLRDSPKGFREAVVSFQMGLPVGDVSCMADVPEECRAYIPGDIARKYTAICFHLTPKVAFCFCTGDTQAFEDELLFHHRTAGSAVRRVVSVYAPHLDIGALVQSRARAKVGVVASVDGQHRVLIEDGGSSAVDVEIRDDVLASQLVLRSRDITSESVFAWVMGQAVLAGSSDVHIEYVGGRGQVRLRVDGILRVLIPGYEMSEQALFGLVNVIKNKARMPEDRYAPLDGSFTLRCKGERYDVRVNAVPVYLGRCQNITCRLLPKSFHLASLDKLRLSAQAMQALKRAATRPQGLVLVTGPTGSGKNTTLNAALSGINDESKKILTLENPIETEIPGLAQCAVDERRGSTMHGLLRAFLRQDPDVIMVGEIRDEDTARIALEASMTGHLVLGTLHTISAAEAATRMAMLSTDAHILAESLILLQGQRLVRELCPRCKKLRSLTGDEAGVMVSQGLGAVERVYAHVGCDSCHGEGYAGRRAAMEVIPVDKDIRRLIASGGDASLGDRVRRMASEKGFVTYFQDALRLCVAGHTSMSEALKLESAFD